MNIKMRDTREYTKKATELMMAGKKIILRTKLANNDIVERVILPVTAPSNKNQHVTYSDTKFVYNLIDKSVDTNDLSKLTYSNMKKIHKVVLSSSSTKNGMLIPLLEVLLMSGYVVCENQ